MSLVKAAIQSGNYHFTGHAEERLQQRQVTRMEVRQVLSSGHHEKRKDKFDTSYNEWNYSIRGKTIDERMLRIVVSFDFSMLIITIIDLDEKEL